MHIIVQFPDLITLLFSSLFKEGAPLTPDRLEGGRGI